MTLLPTRLFAVTVLLILLGQTALITPIRGAALRISEPLRYGAYSAGQGVRVAAEFLIGLGELDKENNDLRQRILSLESQLAMLNEADQENELLRAQLKVQLPDGLEVKKIAQVTGRSTTEGWAVLDLNIGSKDEVEIGDLAVVEQILVGQVEEVFAHSCRVRLITDPEISVSVLDQDSPERSRGITRGEYGSTLVMEKILQDAPVVEGDLIITSGEDGVYPKSLIVGRVEEVYKSDVEVLKSARVRTLVDFGKVEKVFVLEKEKSK